jgi:hypothetical protein
LERKELESAFISHNQRVRTSIAYAYPADISLWFSNPADISLWFLQPGRNQPRVFRQDFSTRSFGLVSFFPLPLSSFFLSVSAVFDHKSPPQPDDLSA